MKYIIGNETYSKAAAIRKIREIIDKYFKKNERVVVTDEKDIDFLQYVCQLHHFYKDKSIVGFYVCPYKRVRKKTKKMKSLEVKIKDGGDKEILLPWSPISCFQSTKDFISQNFRLAIKKDIRKFWREKIKAGEALCAISGKSLTKRNTEVDHKAPKTFSFLLDKFLMECGHSDEEIKIYISSWKTWEMKNKGKRNKDKDSFPSCPNILKEWEDFHRRECDLRLLEKKIHRNLKKKIK